MKNTITILAFCDVYLVLHLLVHSVSRNASDRGI